MITEVPLVQDVPETPVVIEDISEEPVVVVQDDNAGIPEETDNASLEANKGQSSRSSLNNSIHSSDNIQSDSMNADGSSSNAPDSSRGSTKVSGTDIEAILYPED